MSEALAQTIFSFSGDVPAAESPDGALGPFSPGALTHGSIREACSIRKLTGGGAILHVESALGAGERLDLELEDGFRLGGTIAWRTGSEVGLRFDAPLDVFALIARGLVSQPGERRRMPRIELRCPAWLESAQGGQFVTTRDVSQGGAKVESRSPFGPDEPVRITLDGFRPVDGVARWSGNGLAGIAFEPELAWQELMPWLKQRRDAALARGPDRPPPLPAPPPPPALARLEPPPAGSVDLNLPARVREGTRRWNIAVAAITTHHVEFESFAALRLGSLLWLILPGLEGWPARIVEIDGYRFTCAFTQQLHPAVLERVLAAARG